MTTNDVGVRVGVVAIPPNGSPTSIPRPDWQSQVAVAGPLVMDHLLPAGLWLIQLLAKVTALNLYFGAANHPSTLAMVAYSLQQGLTCTFTAINVVFFLTRNPVIGRRSPMTNRLVALIGTFVLLAPITRPVAQDQPLLLLVSSAIILVGMLLAIASILTLGRCFGLFPEARGLVTRGPYRIVRHPLYLGEIIAAFGVVVGTASPAFAGLVVLLVAFQYWRAALEERALAVVFPEYVAYQQRTWRIVPGLH